MDISIFRNSQVLKQLYPDNDITLEWLNIHKKNFIQYLEISDDILSKINLLHQFKITPDYEDTLTIIGNKILCFTIDIQQIKELNNDIVHDIIHNDCNKISILSHLINGTKCDDINCYTYSVPLFEYYINSNNLETEISSIFKTIDITKAVKNGGLDVIVCLTNKFSAWGYKEFIKCLNGGDKMVIQYLYENGFEYDKPQDLLYEASKSGNIDCIKYVYENIYENVVPSWSSLHLGAAESGNLQCLKYVHEDLLKKINIFDKSICKYAALSGNLECLEYVHKRGAIMTKYVCENAAKANNIECLKYAYQNGSIIDEVCLANATQNNNLEMVKFIHSVGVPLDTQITYIFAMYGNYDALVWCYEKNVKWDSNIYQHLATKNKLDCLKFVIEHRLPDNDLCDNYDYYIGKEGDIECIKFLCENGYNITDELINSVIYSGNKENIQYCLDMKVPFSKQTCSDAAYVNDLPTLMKLHELGCPWDVETCLNAVYVGSIDCLKYAHTNGCPWNKNVCSAAIECGQYECLEYAYLNGCPIYDNDMWALKFIKM